MLILAGELFMSSWPQKRSEGVVRAFAQSAKRSRAFVGGIRSGDETTVGKLPAGFYPRRAGEHGANSEPAQKVDVDLADKIDTTREIRSKKQGVAPSLRW